MTRTPTNRNNVPYFPPLAPTNLSLRLLLPPMPLRRHPIHHQTLPAFTRERSKGRGGLHRDRVRLHALRDQRHRGLPSESGGFQVGEGEGGMLIRLLLFFAIYRN